MTPRPKPPMAELRRIAGVSCGEYLPDLDQSRYQDVPGVTAFPTYPGHAELEPEDLAQFALYVWHLGRKAGLEEGAALFDADADHHREQRKAIEGGMPESNLDHDRLARAENESRRTARRIRALAGQGGGE